MSETTTASIWQHDPASVLAQRCAAMADGLPVNPALMAEVCWSLRPQGDWLAAVISPAFVRLVLLPGGGDLWGGIPLGQQRYLALGAMDWRFRAAHDAVLGEYQWLDLVESIATVGSMATARHLVGDARIALGLAADVVSPDEIAPAPVSRRGFLRALTGRR